MHTQIYACLGWGHGTNFFHSSISIHFSKLWKHCPSVNSLGPSGAIWRQRSGSTLAQVTACCLTAPSHYLNQCWLIISKVEWHSSKGEIPQPSITEIIWKIKDLKFHSNFQGANELNDKFISNQNQHSLDASTPVKHECKPRDLTGTFAKSVTSLREIENPIWRSIPTRITWHSRKPWLMNKIQQEIIDNKLSFLQDEIILISGV